LGQVFKIASLTYLHLDSIWSHEVIVCQHSISSWRPLFISALQTISHVSVHLPLTQSPSAHSAFAIRLFQNTLEVVLLDNPLVEHEHMQIHIKKYILGMIFGVFGPLQLINKIAIIISQLILFIISPSMLQICQQSP